MAKVLTPLIPQAFGTYWEPFVGDGALFYEANGRISQAFLSDINADFITFDSTVKQDPNPILPHWSPAHRGTLRPIAMLSVANTHFKTPPR